MVLPKLSDVNTTGYFSLAVGCIAMWLVPNIGIEVSGYRVALIKSPYWHEDGVLKEGNRAITRTALASSTACVLVYVATAIGVGLSTQNLDPRAMSIIYGLSLFVGCVILFELSCEIPRWLGVYYSEKANWGEPVGRTVKHLRFNLAWSIGRIFLSMYILLTFFFCGAAPETIPVSGLLGVFSGYIVYYGIYFGRTTFEAHKRAIAFAMAAFLSILSAVSLGVGCGYIQDVWGSIQARISVVNLFLITFFSSLIAGFIVHYLLWRNSRKMFDKRAVAESEGRRSQFLSFTYKTQHFDPRILKELKLMDKETEKQEIEDNMSKVTKGEEDISWGDEKQESEQTAESAGWGEGARVRRKAQDGYS